MEIIIYNGLLIFLMIFTTIVTCQELSITLSSDAPVSLGDDVTVHCRVEDFPAGGAIVWWKRQGDEEVKLGENNALEVTVDRYSLLMNQASSTVLFYFNIRGIQPEDNGDFGCSLEGGEKYYKNVVFADPVQDIRLYRMPSANLTDEPSREFTDGEEFHFEDGEDYFFLCIASGSNPMPEIDMSIGYLDGKESLNDLFVREDELISDPTSGDVAFRKTNYQTSFINKEPIAVSWRANSQELKCSASVPNQETPKTIQIKPILKIPPVIECEGSRKVRLWTERVEISCDIYADPATQEIRWFWGDGNTGVSLVPGEFFGHIKFILEDGDKPDHKVARLHFTRTFAQMYHKYNLVAKNRKGLATHVFSLERDFEEDAISNSASTISVSLTFVAAVCTMFVL